jgi:hypothetical protein
MAAIAIATATIAYHSAKWATEAADKDGVALQERAERERVLQRINIELAEDARLWSRYQAHDQAATTIKTEADTIRTSAPDEAAILDLEYQGHWAAMRALWPLFQDARPAVVDGELVFDADTARTSLVLGSAELRGLKPGASQDDAVAAHEQALALVLMIVFLVGALLLLTIAQVVDRGAPILAIIGVGLALATALIVQSVDPDITPWLVGIVMVAISVYVAWRLAWRFRARLPRWILSAEERASAKERAEARAEAAEERAEAAETTIHGAERARFIQDHGPFEPTLYKDEAHGDRTVKTIAVLIAATSLVAASIGFLQIRTLHQAEEQAQSAQGHALMALASEIEESTKAETAIFAHVRAIETSVAATNIRQQRMYWLSAGDDRRAADLAVVERAQEAEARAAAAGAITGRDGQLDYATDPPTGDPAFPAHYRLRSEQDALGHAAMQDAANAASAKLTSRGREYTFGVAVLAILLYLLGLSLVLRARTLRLIFWVASIALVVIFVLRIGPTLGKPIDIGTAGIGMDSNGTEMDGTVDPAAQAYAAGTVGYQVARDRAEFDQAISDLKTATKARPDFVQAQMALADAFISSTSVQSAGYTSVDDPTSRQDAITAMQAAIAANNAAHGVGEGEPDAPLDPRVYVNVGFHLYRSAIDRPAIDGATLIESRRYTQEAIRQATRDDADSLAVSQANLGVAYLAEGKTEEAQLAYEAMTAAANEPDATSLTGRYWWRDAVVAGALTDLDNLATRHASVRARAEAMKATLVRMVYGRTADDSVSLTNLSIEPFPSMLQWLADGPANLEKRVVVTEWYRHDRVSGDWYIIPEISGPGVGASDSPVLFYPDSERPGGYFGQGAMTASTELRCHSDGDEYRVEVYVDGTLAGTAKTTVGADKTRPVEAGNMRAVDARDLGVAFCHPIGWTRLPQSMPGVVVGYVDPANIGPDRGLFVFRVQRPVSLRAAGHIDDAIDEVISDAGNRTLLPGMTFDSDEKASWHDVKGVVERYYTTAGGLALLLAVPNADGSVTVGVVKGPEVDFDVGGLGLLLMDSLLPHN